MPVVAASNVMPELILRHFLIDYPADRLLATRLGTACADLIQSEVSGVMVAARAEATEAMPLEDVAGRKKLVPPDHPWIESARRVGTNLGD